MNIKLRLTVLSFLQFAVWGAYLTSMGGYLASAGLAGGIRWFYSVQGFVALFMPALVGIVADRLVEGQRLLSLSHLLAGAFMMALCFRCFLSAGSGISFTPLFLLYSLSIIFFVPTISLVNSVAYSALEGAGIDIVRAFPPIRVWGTVGFIVSMWVVDLMGWQLSPLQFAWSGLLSLLLALYSLTLPACPVSRGRQGRTLSEAFGLRAFSLFRDRRMAVFFVFSVLLGFCLHVSNGYASPFLHSFAADEAYSGTFGVRHAGILISLSQMSEALCLFLIPFFLRRFGIKRVMLIALVAWALRYAFFALGNPGSGVWLFVLSMLVYGVAFDFFNVSGSLFVARQTDLSIRSSAQGLFLMMTNGIGASLGMIVAGAVVDAHTANVGGLQVSLAGTGGWTSVWYIFAVYSIVFALAFARLFREGYCISVKQM